MIGNLKKWKEGALSRMVDVKGKQQSLSFHYGFSAHGTYIS